MEDKKKQQEHASDHIELRHREMTDILGDTPDWFIHSGSYVAYGFILLFLLCSILIKYPNVVHGYVEIEDLANVEWVITNSTGLVDRVFVQDHSEVKEGDTLFVIKNPAVLRDVEKFCDILTNVEDFYMTGDVSYLKKYPFDLIMGEMSDAYEKFTMAVRNCLIFEELDFYNQKKDFLLKERNVLNKEPDENEIAVLRLERELFLLRIENEAEHKRTRRELELAYENMVNSIKRWESKYLIRSNSHGHIVLGGDWAVNKNVNQGDTLCTVLSNNEGVYTGKMLVAQDKIAEIKKGNQVNISLSQYPSRTYGILIGEVASISFVPYNKMYAIDIVFPKGLISVTNKELVYELGMRGKAEIVTSRQNVLLRIFGPIYNLIKSI